MADTAHPVDSSQPPPPPPAPEPARRGGMWMVALMLSLATVLAVIASFRFGASERYLTEAHARFAERGRELTVDECVVEVLAWRTECEAMKSLCDSNVERMMDACLSGQDRSAYCAEAGEALGDSHFAAAACTAHEVDRKKREPWKFCGMAYRAIDLHCRQLRSNKTDG